MDEHLQKILHNLFTYMNEDKIRFYKFCVSRGHSKKDIAEAMNLTPSGLSKFIKRQGLNERIK